MPDRPVAVSEVFPDGLPVVAYRAGQRADGGPDDLTRPLRRVADAGVVQVPDDAVYVIAGVVDGAWRYVTAPAHASPAEAGEDTRLLERIAAAAERPAPTDPALAGALGQVVDRLAVPPATSNSLQQAVRVGTGYNATLDDVEPDPAQQGLVGMLHNPPGSGVVLVLWRVSISASAYGAARAIRRLDAQPTGAEVPDTNRGGWTRPSAAGLYPARQVALRGGVLSRGYHLEPFVPVFTPVDDTAALMPGRGSAFSFVPANRWARPLVFLEWVWREVAEDAWLALSELERQSLAAQDPRLDPGPAALPA